MESFKETMENEKLPKTKQEPKTNEDYVSIIAPITVTPRINTQTDRNIVKNPFTMDKLKN
jgi:hypothetical protein